MPERIEAVLQLRELGRGITTISTGSCEVLKEIAMPQDHNHLNHATWQKGESLDRIAQNVDTSCGIFRVANPGEAILRLDGRAERRAAPTSESRSSRQAVGSVATEARVLMKSRLSSQNPL